MNPKTLQNINRIRLVSVVAQDVADFFMNDPEAFLYQKDISEITPEGLKSRVPDIMQAFGLVRETHRNVIRYRLKTPEETSKVKDVRKT